MLEAIFASLLIDLEINCANIKKKNIWSGFNMIYKTDISPASLGVPWVRNLSCPPTLWASLLGPSTEKGFSACYKKKR